MQRPFLGPTKTHLREMLWEDLLRHEFKPEGLTIGKDLEAYNQIKGRTRRDEKRWFFLFFLIFPILLRVTGSYQRVVSPAHNLAVLDISVKDNPVNIFLTLEKERENFISQSIFGSTSLKAEATEV